MEHLSIRELIQIANEAQVLRRMALDRCTRIIVDHIPARESMSIPRDPGEEDEPLHAETPTVIPVTFTLADAMFGGTVFVTLTCGHRVLINPFPWNGYEHLAQVTITPP